ncbi:MAG TPA: LssY C-terminal domain-containing protein [Thermoanaerobaculia bacterium]|nr:LssY C-terminal domain-containing protein [Thermoanaerobaculia bacterium]
MHRFALRVMTAAFLSLPAYAVLAYVVLPVSWKQYGRFGAHRDLAGVTRTYEGIPGDPLNVELVGSEDQVIAAMRAAGWTPADRIGMRSGLRDVASILFDRPYPSAPVSTHFLYGRAQDLAFQRAVGRSPRRRHHVRLWAVGGPSGATLWVGAATFDRTMGISRFTGELMHHIDPNVDAERETLLSDLGRAGRLAEREYRDGPQGAWRGKNGGGDPYFTDGRLAVASLIR